MSRDREHRHGPHPSGGRRTAHPRAGFTLIELLVALAVTGLVAAAAVDAARAAMDAWERVRDGDAGTLAAGSARLTLAAWMRAVAVSDSMPPVVGASRNLGGLPRDELFVRVDDAGALYPGPHRIHLRVGRLPGAAGSGLLAELMPLRPGPSADADTVLVASGVGGMRLRFLARVDGRDQWLPAWSDAAPPRAVEIRLVPAPYDVMSDSVPLAPLLRLPILAPFPRRERP